jgi:hypothetical protein
VLLPAGVSTWVTTFHHHPYPLVNRTAYLIGRGVEDEARRLQLYGLVTGQAYPNAAVLLWRAIEDYDLSGVCFRREMDSANAIRRALTSLHFERIHTNEVYETWVRPLRAQRP